MYSCYACALFDHGVTHSFVSSSFACKNSLYVIDLLLDLCIIIPMEAMKTVNRLALACSILIKGHKFVADLHLMELRDYGLVWIGFLK